ncbi:MAG TPA: DUF2844 domain-containing protein [Vicinamibacteria bacterium]|nr:DUF2844 domain-containing protein [Vicinamibacteria bacterium]
MKAVITAASMLLLGTTPVWAALGKPVSSVADDGKRLGGEVRTLGLAAGFAVHEISAADGTVVREYASPAGEVFGVSWRGMTRPNLADLLGDHYAAFRDAPRPPGRRRGPLVVRTDHLVVEMGGHMRDFHGRAYLPDRLPASVSSDSIR